MRIRFVSCCLLLLGFPGWALADANLDRFDNDRSPLNGPGTNATWNAPPVPTFRVELETETVHAGRAALKVSWEDKDFWPNFVIGNLQAETMRVDPSSMRMRSEWRSRDRRARSS